MCLILEALCVNLINIFRARWTCGKPAAAGNDFQSTNLGVVAGCASQLGSDRLAGQARLLYRFGRKLLQACLLLRCGRRIDARVVRRPEFFGQFDEVLARILASAGCNFRRRIDWPGSSSYPRLSPLESIRRAHRVRSEWRTRPVAPRSRMR